MGALTDSAPSPFGGGSQLDIDRIEQLWGREVLDNPRIGYNHLVTTSCFLPRTDPGDKGMWERRDGGLIMTMTRGPAMNPRTGEVVLMGYPFGIWPRRFHSILNAEILRNKSRDIYCPSGFCDFFGRRLGGERGRGRALLSGGKNGNITQMKNQFACLVAANFVFFIRNEIKMTMVYPGRLIETMDLWFQGEEEFFPGVFRASQVYVDSLVEHAVPIDLVASACIRSPLEYDIYTWAARRVYSMAERDERLVRIPMDSLLFQFGKSYRSPKDFKKDFTDAVTHLRGHVYPDLNFRPTATGWELRRSPLAVEKRYYGIGVEPKQQSLKF
jgi:Plasmid encoded RepA protein